jgi:predicted HNH restriction endonuclease
MGKRLPYTPSSQIRTALRRLWLRSRERSAALRREGYRCQGCGLKQSRAKGREVVIEVHHIAGSICWAEIEAAIRMWLLVSHEDLRCLCPECHDKAHDKKTQP